MENLQAEQFIILLSLCLQVSNLKDQKSAIKYIVFDFCMYFLKKITKTISFRGFF